MSWSPLYCYSIKKEEAFYKNENVGHKANLAIFIFAEFGHFGSKYGSNGRRSRVSTYHDNLDWKIFNLWQDRILFHFSNIIQLCKLQL